MRHGVLATAALIAAVAWGAGTAQAGKVEIKGAHICCNQCRSAIGGILIVVDGVSNAACAKPDKDKGTGSSITFTTTDAKATTAALTALADKGFLGTATDDGKEVKLDLPTAAGKADQVTVTNTHICCPNGKAALTALFSDDKLDFLDKSTATITGKDLDKAAVLDALRKAGFNGTIK